jgi:hypothetical protein
MDRWEYLITKEYSVRHSIAEHYIDGLDEVIDIGTYKRKLNFSGRLHSIDLLKTFDDTFHGTAAEWKNIYFNQISERFGVVILGFHIEGGSSEIQAVIDLINRAEVAVIDIPMQHQPSVEQFKLVTDQLNKKYHTSINLLLPEMDTPGFPSYNVRNIYIFKGE